MSVFFQLVVLIAFINGSIGFRKNQYDIFHSREKRGIPATIATKVAVQQILGTTQNLKSSFVNGEIHDIGDFAIAMIESMPIVNDIVSLFTNNPSDTADIQTTLNSINNHLETFNSDINNIEEKVEQLLQRLDLSVIQNQVAGDRREIKSCHTDFLLFLEQPGNKADSDRLISCYDKFSYTREIGGILNNEKVTFSQKALFDQIIDNSGYCNGTEIINVFRYLFGIYIDGCNAITAAESLKYNATSTTLKDECTTTINSTKTFFSTLYELCSAQSCTDFEQPLVSVLRETDINISIDIFNETFPWFHFSIFSFDDGRHINEEFFDGQINRLVLKKEGYIFRTVLWLTFKNQYTHGAFQYGLKFDKNALQDQYNGLNLIVYQSSDTTAYVGFHQSNNTLQTECKLVFNDEKQIVPKPDPIKLSIGAIVGIVIGSVVGLIILCCAVCCYARSG